MSKLERMFSPKMQALSILGVALVSLVSLTLALWLALSHATDTAARKAAQRSNCAVWKYMGTAKPPATTERGITLQKEAQRYYREFDCDEVGTP